ncbi:MAG: ABC transporter permease [Mesorhizobium sp.]|uniref:ABC transporter permease n=1 Tax=Mesorhizobium sp. TaxID=1871066 RepID=UPI000FE8B582|nr:ABC transporter permease [Mesorhizobium sp.]RWI57093.1 MAG: ABC transporter permease [Mesorhizobium sp.]
MLRTTVIRLASAAATLLAASFLIFVALHYSPGSSVAFILGGGENNATPEQIALVEAQYGLNDPLLLRYARWIAHAASGDWGQSYSTREKVLDLVGSRLTTTLGLVAMSASFGILTGMALGVLAAVGGVAIGTLITLLTTVVLATPGFVASIVLIAVFAVQLRWFPALGSGEGFWDGLFHLVLPALALGISTSGVIARITRVAVEDEMHREHVQTAVIRGVPTPLILLRHVLRNALIPIVTVAGIIVAALVAGAVIIEIAFNLNGIGTLLVSAVQQKDMPVVQAVSTVIIGIYLLINLSVDLLYVAIDPRVRLESR